MSNDEVTHVDGARTARTARTAAVIAAALFGAIAALHALWALGAAWPFSDRQGLADVVWGGPASTFPSPAATLAVTVLLATAALLVTGRAGLWGARVPRWVLSVGTWGVATVLFLRAVLYGPSSVGSDAVNASWELALFTPLCIVLAGLCVVVARGDVRSRSTQGGSDRPQEALR